MRRLQLSSTEPVLEWNDDKTQKAKFPLSKPENLVHVKTDDERFHAVYDVTGMHMDVFQCSEDGFVEHLFALRRDDYYNEAFFPFFRKIGDEWRLVFNDKFGGFSVFELPDGKKLFHHICPSEFLGNVLPLKIEGHPDRFYYIHSWVWGRHDIHGIYDMTSVASFGKNTKKMLISYSENPDNEWSLFDDYIDDIFYHYSLTKFEETESDCKFTFTMRQAA